MKKYVVSLLAVLVAVITSSFTSGAFKSKELKQETATSYHWYHFNGTGLFQSLDPSYYSLDEDDFPDCPPALGLIYCEVYAAESQEVEGEPDLLTVINCRMRSLL